MRLKYACFLVCVTVWCEAPQVFAEPKPGDLFREYTYTNTYGDAGGAIRVGGKRGVSYPDRGSDFGYVNAWIAFPHLIDLKHATRAELVVEKILSHNGTRGLAIQWNDSEWMALPTPSSIPAPQRNYYHHTCIVQPIKLSVLSSKDANRFRMRVSPEHEWNWPQHLIYGVHLRVYYDPAKKTHATGNVKAADGRVIGRRAQLGIEIASNGRRVCRVDYLARCEDVNWPGDGQYYRWQYFFYHGQLLHHVGSSVTRPFSVVWDTSWVPDQTRPISLAARVVDDTNLIFMTPAVKGLLLERPGLSVELCKPESVPENWVTRRKEYQQTTTIKGDLTDACAARLCWSSWSPGYMHGLFVNGHKVIDVEGPRYRYFDHIVPIGDLSLLKRGRNIISTGKTPLHGGKMVHGMEVNWPGIQLLIQRDTSRDSNQGSVKHRAGLTKGDPSIERSSTECQQPQQQTAGSLIICGGGSLPDSVMSRFIDLAGGGEGKLVVIPTAGSAKPLSNKDKIVQRWHDHGMGSVTVLHTRDRTEADSAEFVEPLTEATALWFSGGQQSRLADAYLGTATERAIVELFRRGGVVGGTSAGAAIQSRVMIQSGNPIPKVTTGFDLLPDSIVDQHFLRRNRFNRLLTAVRNNPDRIGVGIDEGTAVVFHLGECRVLGSSYVSVVAGGKDPEEWSIQTFKSGDTFHLDKRNR